ncbi:MAG: hypothetical protein K2K93_00995 [Muribaculaceae bacterium]|nr:hypothetical protein [Muribaculaceae bacterium]
MSGLLPGLILLPTLADAIRILTAQMQATAGGLYGLDASTHAAASDYDSGANTQEGRCSNRSQPSSFL